MLTSPSQGKLDASVLVPKKGIYKTDTCTWVPEWRGFECDDSLDWRMLSIESMDQDTESRRLSPVAVHHQGGYVDLINGPQVYTPLHTHTHTHISTLYFLLYIVIVHKKSYMMNKREQILSVGP